MSKVERDYRQMLYYNDASSAVEILDRWVQKSDNKELEELQRAVLGVVGYVASLEQERSGFDYITDEQNHNILVLQKEIDNLKEHIRQIKMEAEFNKEL